MASYSEPGPIWDIVDHQQPVPAEMMARLAQGNNAVGVVTVRGMIPTLYFLDQLKEYGVNLWGIEKSGAQHMNIAIYGPLDQVTAAIKGDSGIIGDMLSQYAEQTRTWAVIGNPHPNLAFFLPRAIRVGV